MRASLYLTSLLYVAAAGLGLALAYQVIKGGKKLGEAAAELAEDLNPANPENPVNRGANAAFQAVIGNDVDTIGTWLASKFSGAAQAADAMLGSSPMPAPQPLGSAPFVGDLELDTSPGFTSNAGGAAVGMVRKMR